MKFKFYFLIIIILSLVWINYLLIFHNIAGLIFAILISIFEAFILFYGTEINEVI
jgi:hypothetical protein